MPAARHWLPAFRGTILPREVVPLRQVQGPGRPSSGDQELSEVHTDLAVESLPLAGERFPGVRVEEDETDICRVTRVVVENEVGAIRMGKPPGQYVTIESAGLKRTNRSVHDQIATVFARELCRLMPYGPE